LIELPKAWRVTGIDDQSRGVFDGVSLSKGVLKRRFGGLVKLTPHPELPEHMGTTAIQIIAPIPGVQPVAGQGSSMFRHPTPGQGIQQQSSSTSFQYQFRDVAAVAVHHVPADYQVKVCRPVVVLFNRSRIWAERQSVSASQMQRLLAYPHPANGSSLRRSKG